MTLPTVPLVAIKCSTAPLFLVSSSERYHEAFAEVTEEMVSREAGYGLEVPWVVRLNGVHSQDEGASRNPYC